MIHRPTQTRSAKSEAPLLTNSLDPLQNGGALEVSVCARHGYAHTPQPEVLGPALPRRPRLPASLDLDKIRSPVGCYIKNNPAPQLLR